MREFKKWGRFRPLRPLIGAKVKEKVVGGAKSGRGSRRERESWRRGEE